MALDEMFTGANGTISLAAIGSPAQQADTNAINNAYTEAAIFGPVGRVTNIEVCVRTELQEFYQIGSRDTARLRPGNVHISGKIERAYINGALLYLLLGRGAKPNIQTTSIDPFFNITFTLRNPSSPEDFLKVTVVGVKFENWGFQIPQDTFVMEQVTFKAVLITVEDTEDDNVINVAFPEQQQ